VTGAEKEELLSIMYLKLKKYSSNFWGKRLLGENNNKNFFIPLKCRLMTD
jgi:hypothetical protein